MRYDTSRHGTPGKPYLHAALSSFSYDMPLFAKGETVSKIASEVVSAGFGRVA